jgi:NitT/TauT family transport system permease protein
VVALAVLAIAWEIAGQIANPVVFAPFSGALRGLWGLLVEGELLPAIATSGADLLLGFGAAVLVGVPVGLMAGRNRVAGNAIAPYASILITTPMIAMAPLVLFAFGIGGMARAALVFAFGLGQIIINTSVGARSVEPDRLEMARSFGVTGARALRLVVVRDAAPAIFAGLRLGLGQCIIGVVVAEILVSPVGLGGILTDYAARFRPDRVMAAVIAIGVLALIVMRAAVWMERRACRWAETPDA